MKRIYCVPKLEVNVWQNADIITTSGEKVYSTSGEYNGTKWNGF